MLNLCQNKWTSPHLLYITTSTAKDAFKFKQKGKAFQRLLELLVDSL